MKRNRIAVLIATIAIIPGLTGQQPAPTPAPPSKRAVPRERGSVERIRLPAARAFPTVPPAPAAAPAVSITPMPISPTQNSGSGGATPTVPAAAPAVSITPTPMSPTQNNRSGGATRSIFPSTPAGASPTVERPRPSSEPVHTESGNATGWIIGGLTAAGLAAWGLSGHHAAPREQPRPQSPTEPVPVALTGTVTDDSGAPLVSAAVELLSKSTARAPARRVRTVSQNDASSYTPRAYVETDEKGRYSILTKLRDGAHVLIVSALDHTMQELSIDVTRETQQVVQNVVLHQAAAAATPEPYEQRAIFYATDRAPDERSGRYDYANVASTTPGVAVGRATVSVAHSDGLSAQFTPTAYGHVTRTGRGQAVVDDVSRPLEVAAFSSAVLAEAQRSGSHSIIVYIHGYNQSFDDAVRDAAQFQYETGLDAAVVAYSWPSAHDLLKYAADEDSNSASVGNFVDFISPLKAAASRAQVRIVIVAHSMGNRIAVRGFEQLPDCADTAVMAAPDVYSLEMKNNLKKISEGVKHVTIYASQTDQALLLSNVFHQDYRVGLFEHNPFIATGMDTIDATAVDTSMLGHSYYVESSTVAGDISRFLSGARPAQRPHLEEKSVETFNYWAIVPPR
jgi:esterase/lipase superfamily enzyme